jgi:hypothetical protein
MSTESISPASITLHKHYESYGVYITLIDGMAGGNRCRIGQTVRISANNTVVPCTAGTDLSIGVVTDNDDNDGNKVTVHANILRTSLAIAKGGTLAAGAVIVPDGTVNADGLPGFAAAATGNFVQAVVLRGATVGLQITILHLRSCHTRA